MIAQQRFLAYASEAGESFRPIIPKYMVNFAYAASIIYVGADIAVHTHQMIRENKPRNEIILKTTDRTIWHSFASMLLPAFTVHAIVKYCGKGFNNLAYFNRYPRVRTWGPTMIALTSIPFIIHPIDHATDFVMDNTLRKLY
jgi:fission process protein 1